ncbi:MAG TPA: galactose-1-phosphate uridylyltransferase [Candidatus Marinimicrobia bacterium]|nr:galactose-1-phosphate uridylyltransferase [Candidatus Neomarinimicrobiota bacterium]
MEFSFSDHPHRRYNPLKGEWVLVSPHRTKRPWLGKQEASPSDNRPAYEPGCYLCPGNERAGGKINPHYTSTYVFDNDFAALLPDTPPAINDVNPLMKSESLQGACRVICFSPRHDLTLAKMSVTEIQDVVNVWAEQISELGKRYRWVQIFENKGEIMGCSNPHPHGQIWAGTVLPNEPLKEDRQQLVYFKDNGSRMLLDYLQQELEQKERIVVENKHWVALVPFWAVWPFETLLLPRRHVLRLPDLTIVEREGLAELLKSLLTKYDNLFNVSFPYTMGWHGAPTDMGDYSYWQLHAHFYPPLLRSGTVKKFIVGYEMLAEVQRDITAEQAAERLRELPSIHYKVMSE